MDGIKIKKDEAPILSPTESEEQNRESSTSPKANVGKDKSPKSKKTIIIAVIIILVMAGGVISANNLFKRYNFNKLNKNVEIELEQGNYSTALVLYDKIQNASPEDTEIGSKIEQMKKFLVAEENFQKALQASENEEWLTVEVLLKDSEAILNLDFKFHQEAIELYQQAQALVDSVEREVSETISGLMRDVTSEETKRKQAELQTSQVQSALQQTASQKQQTEQQLQSATSQLQQSQSQLQSEQQRASELAREAEKAVLDKFVNELDVYVGMLRNGNEYLNLAIAEIDKSNDLSAFSYVDKARVLFSEVFDKASDLRNNRTPAGFASQVDELKQSVDLFKSASQDLRNSLIYIESKESGEFDTYYNQGKDKKMQAFTLMRSVEQFVDSN